VRLLEVSQRTRELLFSRIEPMGARLNLLRLPLSATDFSLKPGWTWAWDGTTADPTARPDAMRAIGLVTGAILVLEPALKVIATAWSAPASMKTPPTLEGGKLSSDNSVVDAYGRMLRSQTSWLLAHGVPLTAITLGNEPFHTAGYPTMEMSVPQMVRLAAAVAPSLAEQNVELWAVDHNWEHIDAYRQLLADVPAGTFEAAAFHCYGPTQPAVMAQLAVDKVMTECTGTTDGSEGTFAWDMKNLVDDAIEAGSTGLLIWNLALEPGHKPAPYGAGCDTCRGIVTVDDATPAEVHREPEFFILAHLARAASPGARVLNATTSLPGVRAVSFANPDGTIGVFAYNGTSANQVINIRVQGAAERRFVVAARQLLTARGEAGEPASTE
jgi:glucosylceramidase